MEAERRQSIVFRSQLVFAVWACLFFWAVFMCGLTHDADAVFRIGPVGPILYRTISADAGGLALLAALFGLLMGGWRPLAADALIFIMLGLNIFALNVCYRTWEALGAAVPIAWSVTAAGTGIVLVLADFGLWWIVKKLSSASPLP
jgi:hypothetical protein